MHLPPMRSGTQADTASGLRSPAGAGVDARKSVPLTAVSPMGPWPSAREQKRQKPRWLIASGAPSRVAGAGFEPATFGL